MFNRTLLVEGIKYETNNNNFGFANFICMFDASGHLKVGFYVSGIFEILGF